VLGANGMLGRTVLLQLLTIPELRVALAQRPGSIKKSSGVIADQQFLYEFDANFPDNFIGLFEKFDPGWIINCIGVVKQRQDALDPLICLRVNSVLPHWLASRCTGNGARMIHISTDCVFSGESGYYKETDKPDANDLYGKTKALGEIIDNPNCLTIRTSIIGHEMYSRLGLLEWFLAKQDLAEGYTDAYFSGLTTLELSKIIIDQIRTNSARSGLVHISGPRIAKFDLLDAIRNVYNHTVPLVPNSKIQIDRTLDSSRWESLTGYKCKPWMKMLTELRDWRDQNVPIWRHRGL
jgi:dTDP-4-dehydrorhamnose reductase